MPQRESVVVGVDVGATKILVGYVQRDGAILASRRYRMDRSDQAAALGSIDSALADWFARPWDGPGPLGIGVGLVGFTDPASGTWVQAINIPIHTAVPLASIYGQRYHLPVSLDNDVHAATLAELHMGTAKGLRDFVYLNVGTGIASGLVCNGQLVRGTANYAGELGHMIVEPDGEPCICGGRGCLEPIASGGGILAQVRARLAEYPASSLHRPAQGGTLTSGTVFAAADAGDALASLVAQRALRALGIALVNLTNLLNPEMIVLGGGVFSDGWLIPPLRAYISAQAIRVAQHTLRAVSPSSLSVEHVGLLGAASLAWEHHDRRSPDERE